MKENVRMIRTPNGFKITYNRLYVKGFSSFLRNLVASHNIVLLCLYKLPLAFGGALCYYIATEDKGPAIEYRWPPTVWGRPACRGSGSGNGTAIAALTFERRGKEPTMEAMCGVPG